MAFFPLIPVMLIRQNIIIRGVKRCGADSPETAKTLSEAGVINPNGFPRITERPAERGIIHKTVSGKYCIRKHSVPQYSFPQYDTELF